MDEALILRTLRIGASDWQRVRAAFARRGGSPLAAARAAWAEVFPPSPLPSVSSVCPACGGEVKAAYARGSEFTVGVCAACGHGSMVQGAAAPAVYADANYFAGYLADRAYREAKGARVMQWVEAHASPGKLLEVGSGFGFTRHAAEARGWKTVGVDLNPEAARVAQSLYGMQTFTGTLAQLPAGTFDAVLYQFVLEHVADVTAELKHAAAHLAENGTLALVVPGIEAAEVGVFGEAYRSFRADHLHVFSLRSIDRFLASAGLVRTSVVSECNLHLLAAFLDEASLATLYAEGKGPDLRVTASWPLRPNRAR